MNLEEQIFRIAHGIDLGFCENKDVKWSNLCSYFTQHKESSTKSGNYFVGGSFRLPEGSGKLCARRDENLIDRCLLTLDIDDSGLSLIELGYELSMGIEGAFVAYSTYSHTADKPKIRVVIPLSQAVTAVEYRALAEKFVAGWGVKCDPCSFKPNQLMYMPRCRFGELGNAWTMKVDGLCLDVNTFLAPSATADKPSVLSTPTSSDFDLVSDIEDDVAIQGLMLAVASAPLDISDYEVSAYLDAYPALGSDYHDWLGVGMSLHHQYSGGLEGFERWYEWSNVGSSVDLEDRDDLLRKYNGFGGRSKPRTFASVIHMVNEQGGLDDSVVGDLRRVGKSIITGDSDEFDQLLAEASEIVDMEGYAIFKDKLLNISTVRLGGDLRASIASEIVGAIGKSKGMSKAEIKKAITPAGVSGGQLVSADEVAEWAMEWVYVEMRRLFYNTRRNYGITREAFNAKYDRMEECVGAGMQASQLCLVIYKIEVVVDTIYWPGGASIVTTGGKKMLNSYRKQGAKPCKLSLEDDAEGAELITLFLTHLEHLIEDEVERGIVLHWMVFMYQNPGKRLNWSLVIQGTQGSGKSYIGNVMSLLLGANVQSLDTATISGRFTSWAVGAILNIVEEIRISGTNRWGIMDRIKPYITNDSVVCERKGYDVETLPNFTSYLLLTNHKDAIPLDDEDRRYCIIYCRLQTSEQLHDYFDGVEGVETYFDKLFSLTRARPDALARFFTDYVLPISFKPFGRAPYTEAKGQMVDLAVSEHRDVLDELISKYEDALINDEFIDITHLNNMCVLNGDDIPKGRGLTSMMLEKGYRPIKGRYLMTYAPRKKHYLWVKEGKSDKYAIEKVKVGMEAGRIV
jgi:hypothetical protein